MKFGVFDHVDCGGVSEADHLENRLKIIEAYDRIGIHGYHVAEHHSTPLGFAPSPGMLIAAASQRTTRIKLGPLVYLLPLYEPLRLYEEICMLDSLSKGRFMLGVGRGVSPLELKFFNVDSKEAQSIYTEALECLMRAFKNDTLDFQGDHYSYSNVPITMKPVQKPHPELWYGVLSPETTVWAAQNNVNIVTLALDANARDVTDRYRAEWSKLGKDPDSIPLMGVSRHVVVADTDDEARAIARRAYAKWRYSFDKLWLDNGTSVAVAVPPVAALYPETWDELEAVGNGIAGSPETVRNFVVREAERTGINYLVSWLAFGDMSVEEVTRSVDLFADGVMPAFEVESYLEILAAAE